MKRPTNVRRVRWNVAMVDERTRLGLPTVNLDWDTAAHLFDQGMTPEAAAARIKVKP